MGTILDSRIATGVTSTHRTISGFWGRLLAIVLDGFVLGIVGFVSGLFFFDFYARLGGWGRLIGFGADSMYFGILNSGIGKGQTIGKRIMKIEVYKQIRRTHPPRPISSPQHDSRSAIFSQWNTCPSEPCHVPSWLCDWIHRLRNWWSYHLPLYFQSSYSPKLAMISL